MLSFPQEPLVDVRDVLIARQADRLSAAEKLIKQLVEAIDSMAYYAQTRKKDVNELCFFEAKQGDDNFIKVTQAITAAKQWKEGK